MFSSMLKFAPRHEPKYFSKFFLIKIQKAFVHNHLKKYNKKLIR